jgi:hypothetical protein
MSSENPSTSPLLSHGSSLMRKTQWIYLLPVVTAPVAHIFVSSIHRYRKYRYPLFGLVAVSTCLAVWQRIYFMKHSGYPGAEGDKTNDRYITNPNGVNRTIVRG